MQASIAFATLLLVNCAAARDTWYFRGTPNGWKANAVERRPNDGRFCHTEAFAANGDGFKFSAGDNDWNEAYPSSNWVIHEGKGVYDICFDEGSKNIAVSKLAENYNGPTMVSKKGTMPLTKKVSRYGRTEYVRIEDFEANTYVQINDLPFNERHFISETGRFKFHYRDWDNKVTITKL